MSEQEALQILVVDDEAVVRDFLIRFLSMQSLKAKAVESGLLAIEAMRSEKFDLVFLDLRMPKMGGIETYSELKKIDPFITCVFMTGYAIEEGVLDVGKHPGTLCLKKPFEDLSQIKEIINKVTRQPRASLEAAESAKRKSRRSGQASQDTYSASGCERRAYPRFEAALNVDYRPKKAQVEFIHSVSRNISLGGIRILTQKELAPSTELDLIINDTKHNKSCAAAGTVIWSKIAEDKPDSYDTGIKFTGVNFMELAAIIAHYHA